MISIDKTKEAKKGYWTNDEHRGFSIVVSPGYEEQTTRISITSEYWYRVQHFDIVCDPDRAWKLVNDAMSQCGRTLIPAITSTTDGAVITNYTVAYLNAKQVDQIYYLLKHSLTTANLQFSISHTLGFDTSKSIPNKDMSVVDVAMIVGTPSAKSSEIFNSTDFPVLQSASIAAVEEDLLVESAKSRRRRRRGNANKDPSLVYSQPKLEKIVQPAIEEVEVPLSYAAACRKKN